MNNLTDRGQSLDSPSRLVAVNLANGNPLFRLDILIIYFNLIFIY